jgi:hypothetical protein
VVKGKANNSKADVIGEEKSHTISETFEDGIMTMADRGAAGK